MLPAILPTTKPRSAFGPPYGKLWGAITVLTAASGLFVPKRGGMAWVIATGPGGPGVANVRSGAGGGTAIGLVDLAGLHNIPYQVGQAGTTNNTTFLGLTGFYGTNLIPGAASGGLLNIPGERGEGPGAEPGSAIDIPGRDCPWVETQTAEVFVPDPPPGHYETQVTYIDHVIPNLSYSGTYPITGPSSNLPGGGSVWGGGDALAPAPASNPGVGGGCSADSGAVGGPGLLVIVER